MLYLECYQKTYKPIKTSQNWSKLVETGQNWSKLVETGPKWSKLSKLVKTCDGLPCSKTNRTFIWTFLNLISLLSDTSNHGWRFMFYESLIILNISTLNFSERVLASVLDTRVCPDLIRSLWCKPLYCPARDCSVCFLIWTQIQRAQGCQKSETLWGIQICPFIQHIIIE